ncbi:hypothetical protein BDZ91DRAFT_735135 [Kalaharituber pfeilii]|nr:hypothetical protein BDZ91DRAFT_735135 [Kalaharituber pfeilii]
MPSPAQPAPTLDKSDKTPMVRHTAIAACAPTDTDGESTQHIFFQDVTGTIRSFTGPNAEGEYVGGAAADVITPASNAKWHSPLAAVGYYIGCPCKYEHTDTCKKQHVPRVHLFYVNGENFLRSVLDNGNEWTTASEFNKKLIKVHANTNLAAIVSREKSTGSLMLRLYYQGTDDKVHEQKFTPKAGWKPGNLEREAITGTGLAACVHPDTGEVSVFYQDPQGFIQEATRTGDGWKKGMEVAQAQVPQIALAALCTTHQPPDLGTRLFMLPMEGASVPVISFQWSSDGTKLYRRERQLKNNTPIPFSHVAALSCIEKETETIKVFYQNSNHQIAYLIQKDGKMETRLLKVDAD